MWLNINILKMRPKGVPIFKKKVTMRYTTSLALAYACIVVKPLSAIFIAEIASNCVVRLLAWPSLVTDATKHLAWKIINSNVQNVQTSKHPQNEASKSKPFRDKSLVYISNCKVVALYQGVPCLSMGPQFKSLLIIWIDTSYDHLTNDCNSATGNTLIKLSKSNCSWRCHIGPNPNQMPWTGRIRPTRWTATKWTLKSCLIIFVLIPICSYISNV